MKTTSIAELKKLNGTELDSVLAEGNKELLFVVCNPNNEFEKVALVPFETCLALMCDLHAADIGESHIMASDGAGKLKPVSLASILKFIATSEQPDKDTLSDFDIVLFRANGNGDLDKIPFSKFVGAIRSVCDIPDDLTDQLAVIGKLQGRCRALEQSATAFGETLDSHAHGIEDALGRTQTLTQQLQVLTQQMQTLSQQVHTVSQQIQTLMQEDTQVLAQQVRALAQRVQALAAANGA